MTKEEKIYTYGCNDCDETYEFEHPQTYKNCTKCEWRGELRLHSIEVIDCTCEFCGNKMSQEDFDYCDICGDCLEKEVVDE